MAIIYKNPMPMSGALFVENPRRKKRKTKSTTRRNALRLNGPKNRMIRAATGMSIKQIKDLKASDYKKFEALFEQAGGQSTLDKIRGELLPDGRRAGRAFGTGMGKLKKKYAKEFNDPAKRKAILAAYFSGGTVKIGKKTIDPRAEVDLMGDTVGRYSIVSGAKKASASKGKPRKSRSKGSAASKSVETMELSRTQSGRYRLGNKFISKADAAAIMGVNVDDIELMALSNPRGKKMRINSWPNDAAGHRKAALKGWRKRRAAMKKKKTTKSKSKRKASVSKSKVSSSKHSTLLKKAHKAVAKKKFRSAKSRMKAVWAEYKKLAGGKSSSKKTRKVARAASKKRSAAKKSNAWIKFLKKFGNRGLSREQLRRLYKKKDQQASVLKGLPKVRKKKGATTKRRKEARSLARSAVRVSKRGTQQRLMGPYMARLNPALSVGGMLGSVQNFVGDIPVVRTIAPAIVPLALGVGVYYVHQLAEPYVMPLITKVGGYVAKVPVVGRAVPFLLTKPYTMTGLVAASALGLLARYDILSSQDAAMIGGTAIAMGVGLDLSLKPFAEAAAAVESQIAVADAASADASYPTDSSVIGTSSAGSFVDESTMQGIHMGAVHMGRLAVDEDYFDASFGDAYAAGDDMHPEEISAAVAGRQYFRHKFGQSPRRISGQQSIYSRHAGRQGHRWGWCIKMIGFANFQKIAALPPHQRRQVIGRLRQQAIQSLPKIIAEAQAAQPALETASLPIDGAANAVGGVDGIQYGALMFAGNGY